MASNASTSSVASSSTTMMAEIRQQAEALPIKRGEIGYEEGQRPHSDETATEQPEVQTIPTRHPADREPSPAPGSPSTSDDVALPNAAPASTTDASSTHKSKKHTLISIFTARKFGGLHSTTLLRFLFQLLFLGGTLAGWVIVAQRVGRSSSDAESNALSNDPDSVVMGGAGTIFIHVAFGVATLAQLIFLERCIFHLRAQRYCHLHPGAVMPTHGRSLNTTSPSMAFAPWNRPPLPTYAAALAQSGYGTGDVEDNIIAIPPPPAYGNTRGSTLLLAGFLRNSLRRSSSRVERDSRAIQPGERPMSYVSRDEAWEERCDAERALRLEETLVRLEEGNSISRQPTAR